jgi:hypothetical protein
LGRGEFFTGVLGWVVKNSAHFRGGQNSQLLAIQRLAPLPCIQNGPNLSPKTPNSWDRGE